MSSASSAAALTLLGHVQPAIAKRRVRHHDHGIKEHPGEDAPYERHETPVVLERIGEADRAVESADDGSQAVCDDGFRGRQDRGNDDVYEERTIGRLRVERPPARCGEYRRSQKRPRDPEEEHHHDVVRDVHRFPIGEIAEYLLRHEEGSDDERKRHDS